MLMRKPTKKDRKLLAQYIKADPDHRGKVEPEFFLVNYENMEQAIAADAVGIECMVIDAEDGSGPIFLRIERALRVHVQFAPPAVARKEKLQQAQLMREAFTWLIKSCHDAGLREVMFQSKAAPLIRFCQKRFGFKKSPNELRRTVAHDSASVRNPEKP